MPKESIEDLIEQATKMAAWLREHFDEASKAGFTMENIEKLERTTVELIQEKRKEDEIKANLAAHAAAQDAEYIRLTAKLAKVYRSGIFGAHGKNWNPIELLRMR